MLEKNVEFNDFIKDQVKILVTDDQIILDLADRAIVIQPATTNRKLFLQITFVDKDGDSI